MVETFDYEIEISHRTQWVEMVDSGRFCVNEDSDRNAMIQH